MPLKIEYLGVEELTPYERNTRKHEAEDVDAIASSIRKYGMNDPIGVWGMENLIVEGHGRLLACKQLGLTEVPVIRLDHLTDEERREYAIVHNRSAELSAWDADMLAIEMEDLSFDGIDIEMDDVMPSVELEEASAVDDGYEVSPPAEPKAKQGDIYQLGRHRLMCGDSTDPSCVEMLTGGGYRWICS